MKKSLNFKFLAVMLVLLGCEKGGLTESQVKELRLESFVLERNIKAMTSLVFALKNKDYVSGTLPVKEGEKITGYYVGFVNSSSVSIYYGKAPKVGFKQHSDGEYYWTLDGVWIPDVSEEKIAVVKKRPIVTFDKGSWLLSVDNGSSWKVIAIVDSKNIGKVGGPVFTLLTETDKLVEIILTDGTKITYPKNINFRLLVDPYTDVGIVAGENVKLNYSIIGGDENTTVTYTPLSGWSAQISKNSDNEGSIRVFAPDPLIGGTMLITAFDGYNKSSSVTVDFSAGYAHLEYSQVLLSNNSIWESVVRVQSNVFYRGEIPESASDWLYTEDNKEDPDVRPSMFSTWAFKAKANPGPTREAVINLVSAGGRVLASLTVTQLGGYQEN
jgi:hypothetical protein